MIQNRPTLPCHPSVTNQKKRNKSFRITCKAKVGRLTMEEYQDRSAASDSDNWQIIR